MSWVVKYEVNSNHLGKNGAIAERVAHCSQPGSDIAQHSQSLFVGGGDDIEINIHIQDYRPNHYQVVQVWAAHTYQPRERTESCDNIIRFTISSFVDKYPISLLFTSQLTNLNHW